VNVKGYHGDNGIFTAQPWKQHSEARGQTLDLSGVGAHHQNGIAERAICTIVGSSRTMMLHAIIHWPDETKLDLWTFALQYAIRLHNHIPQHGKTVTPYEVFTNSIDVNSSLQNARVWGCPAYVLDPTIQDGKKLPKWQPRARCGQFLGFSDSHSATVGLIKNLRTGFVSPQYHIICDEQFQTIHLDHSADISIFDDPISFPHLKAAYDEDDAPPLHDDWLTDEEQATRRKLKPLRGVIQSNTIQTPTLNREGVEPTFTPSSTPVSTRTTTPSSQRSSNDNEPMKELPSDSTPSSPSGPSQQSNESVQEQDTGDLPIARRLPFRQARNRQYRGSSNPFPRAFFTDMTDKQFEQHIQYEDAFLAALPSSTHLTFQSALS
jgi:hypothetical protein